MSRFTKQFSHQSMGLRIFPDKILREYAEPVHTFDKALESFTEQMFAFMTEYKGIGLAASQVGVLYRVITINIEEVERFLINPEILSSSSDHQREEEGCLSIPDKWFDVNRSYEIEVKARNPEGKKLHFKASGLNARVLQHEIDHLNGILICDKK